MDDISVISSDSPLQQSSVPTDGLSLLSRVPDYASQPRERSPSPDTIGPPRYYEPAADPPVPAGADRRSPGAEREDERRKRSELMFALRKLQDAGHIVADHQDMSLQTLQDEVDRVTTAAAAKRSVAFQRKLLITFISGIEMLNTKFDPFGANLDGWSEAVHSDLDSYDDIFEKLYLKYRGRAEMSPEASLILSLTGSAVMFHMQREMFKPVPRPAAPAAPAAPAGRPTVAAPRAAAPPKGAGVRRADKIEDVMKQLETDAMNDAAVSVIGSSSSSDSSRSGSSGNRSKRSAVSRATTATRKRRMMQLAI